MAEDAKARAVMNAKSQHVTIPAERRFASNEADTDGDSQTGVLSLSDKPLGPSLRPSMPEIFAALDAAGASDFELERDLSLPVEREWI